MSSLDEFIAVADQAIQFPHSAFRIAELAESLDTPLAELIAMVEEDPGFSVRLLRLVNSAAFPRLSEVGISSLSEAVIRVVRQKIGELAMLQASRAAFGNLESEMLRISTHFEHSLQTATIARMMAESANLSPSLCYSAGLLHDIGLLLIFFAQGPNIQEVLDYSLDHDVSLIDAERRYFGLDHQELGAELACRWNLPDNLGSAIAYHHCPEQLPKDRATDSSLVWCIAIANEMAGDSSQLSDSCKSWLNLSKLKTPQEFDDLLSMAVAGFDEARAVSAALD